jgi:hypothetical protein
MAALHVMDGVVTGKCNIHGPSAQRAMLGIRVQMESDMISVVLGVVHVATSVAGSMAV